MFNITIKTKTVYTVEYTFMSKAYDQRDGNYTKYTEKVENFSEVQPAIDRALELENSNAAKDILVIRKEIIDYKKR